MLALRVSPANEDDRKKVEKLCEEVQKATGETVELAYVDQGYTGQKASEAAAEHGIRLEVVSSTRRPRAASYSYQGDGWWSETSRGHHAFGDW